MIHFLKYVSSRLFLGTFLAVFATYRILAWSHEVLYAGRVMDDRWLIFWIYLSCLVLVSLAMSLWGRWRYYRTLAKQLERIRAQYHPKILVKAHRRLVRYLDSCYFINWTRQRLKRSATKRFGEILLGMRIDDDQALAIYEDILQWEPENNKYYRFLVFAYSRRAKLSERSFQYLRRRYHERPDDRLVGVLAREYTVRKILNFESERVLERCLELYPEHRQKVLKFVVPRLLHFKRRDDNAARFYLAAFDAGWGSRVQGRLETLQLRYRQKERKDALALRLEQALSGKGVPAGKAGGDREQAVGDSSGKARDLDRFSPEPAAEREGEGEDLRLTGLIYADEEEGKYGQENGKLLKMSWGSRLHGIFQRFFATGRPASGNLGRWVGIIVLLILALILLFLSRPIAENLAR